SLKKDREWQRLQEACLQDIHRARGYADSLIGAWHEHRVLAANLRRAVGILKDTLAEAEKTASAKAQPSGPDPYLVPIRDFLAKERLLPKHFGRPIVSSADLLLHLESAALTNLVQAQLWQKSPATDKPELIDKIAESFWRDPKVRDFSIRFLEY